MSLKPWALLWIRSSLGLIIVCTVLKLATLSCSNEYTHSISFVFYTENIASNAYEQYLNEWNSKLKRLEKFKHSVKQIRMFIFKWLDSYAYFCFNYRQKIKYK